MKTFTSAASVLTAGLLFCSCQWPSERVLWSPDGNRAAVIGDSGLHLCNARGDLSPLLVSNAVRVAWLRDSISALVVVQSVSTNWDDIASLLPASALAQAANHASAVLSFVRTNSPESLKAHGIPLLSQHPCGGLACLYIRQRHGKEFCQRLGDAATNYPAIAGLFELRFCTFRGNEIAFSRTLAASEREILCLAASPDGESYAYTTADWDPRSGIVQPACLYAGLMADPSVSSRPTLVHDACSVTFAWTGNSYGLVFIRGVRSTTHPWETCEMSIGALTRVASPYTTPSIRIDMSSPSFEIDMSSAGVPSSADATLVREQGDLSLTIFDPRMRVLCAPTDEVLYTAPVAEFPWPLSGQDGGRGAADLPIGLFRLDLSKADAANANLVGTRRVLPRGVESPIGDLRMLAWNPDRSSFAVACETGRMSIVTLETGTIRSVLQVRDGCPENREVWTPRTLPTWRSADELCFAVEAGSPMGSSNRAEIVLWSLSNRTSRCLSATWPSNAVSAFLSR